MSGLLEGGRLPMVFTLADLKQQLDGDENAAMELARRWLESGQVRQVAPPRPVFIRLNGAEVPEEPHLCLALARTFPSVVVVGGSALWRQGASRQRDALLHCAVSESVEQLMLPGVRLHQRPAGWLQAVSRADGLQGQLHELPLLTAEMAVADAARFADVWVPDRDQLDGAGLDAARVAAAEQALASL
ncbi:hypothetical protein ACLD02_02280 [Alloalcanivorax sp. C16-2]|uniref:hypothetical protein n=1 Tax=Alloalcanivorax TaxID=3020832 RepID=UPI0019347AD9|nr:hypothetical protein [Alloalcanivorax marinus]MBL7250901.1 hypothetical protein [Alloalcanivorax marinus]